LAFYKAPEIKHKEQRSKHNVGIACGDMQRTKNKAKSTKVESPAAIHSLNFAL
jgi:hypothetical protein